MKKPASLVAAIVLWLIALAQLLRVIFRGEVTAQGVHIPLAGERRGRREGEEFTAWLDLGGADAPGVRD
jgi:hypothetical protein